MQLFLRFDGFCGRRKKCWRVENMTRRPITNKELKRRIVEISYKLKLSHIGSCLAVVDAIADIYNKKKSDEKFVLSSGHAHLSHLVVMELHEVIVGDHGIDPIEAAIERFGIHCDRQAGC